MRWLVLKGKALLMNPHAYGKCLGLDVGTCWGSLPYSELVLVMAVFESHLSGLLRSILTTMHGRCALHT